MSAVLNCDLCGQPIPQAEDVIAIVLMKNVGSSLLVLARMTGSLPRMTEYHGCSECITMFEIALSDTKRQLLQHGRTFKRA